MLALFAFALGGNARAHHGTAVTRAQNANGGRFGFTAGQNKGLSGQVGLSLGLAHFGRTMRGSQSSEKLRLGTATLHTLDLQLGVSKYRKWAVELAVPMGQMLQRPQNAAARSEWGLGDLRLLGRLELLRLLGLSSARDFLWLIGGVEAPTGKYREEQALSAIEVEGLKDGAINVQTYNVQTSLGAGLWTPRTGLRYERKLGERFFGAAQGSLMFPVGYTSDKHRWGSDVGGQAALGALFFANSAQATLGLEYWNHLPDHVWFQPDPATPGTRERVGGRQSISTALGLDFRWGSRWSCHLQARVPLWQQVQGVTLVQSVSASAGCSAQIGLGGGTKPRPASGQ